MTQTAHPQIERSTSSPLADLPRPYKRDLSGPELETFAATLAEHPELWIDLIKHDSTQRLYEELFSDDHITAWLICWMDGHDTGFHDHDGSAGAVTILSGAVREERLVLDGPRHTRLCTAGEHFHFSPADIHRVRHTGADPAVTLHVYSPPLESMGAYLINDDGTLVRQPVANTEELRPLRPATDPALSTTSSAAGIS